VFWILLLYMPILAFTAGLLEYVDFVDLVAGDDAWGRDLLPGLFLFPLAPPCRFLGSVESWRRRSDVLRASSFFLNLFIL